jgi:hypothetical protein
MEPFQHEGKTVPFFEHTGTVFSSRKRSEINLRSSGGGGYLQGGSGYVSGPTVTSTVSTKHEFWVRTDQGEEIPVQLTNSDIPLAEGQRVSLFYAESSRATKMHLVKMVNHSAAQRWEFPRAIRAIVAELMPRRRLLSVAAVVALLVAGKKWGDAQRAQGGHVYAGVLWIVAVGYVIYRLDHRRRKLNATTKHLEVWLSQLSGLDVARPG